jgi:folate-dependent phosphoribosylglycinamide formyltransferase PurN
VEHRLYPEVLAAIAEGRVSVEGRCVHVRRQ